MFGPIKRVLIVAPHPDDETLGAGGTIKRLVDDGHEVTVAVMTGRGASPHPLFDDRAFEIVRTEFGAAMDVLGVQNTIWAGLPTTLLTEVPTYQINRAAAEIVASVDPDLVFLPFEHDLHRDHGLVSYAFSVALRPQLASRRKPHMTLYYEVPSETHLQAGYLHPAFDPQVFIDVSEQIHAKLAALNCFKSQIGGAPELRSLNAVEALATWRGAQIGRRAAEAFVVGRQVI